MFRKLVMAVPIAVLVVGGTTACATKNFVRQNVGEVNEKVDSLGRSLEETQERTRQNEGRITEVDQRAQAGVQQATQQAQAANTAAGAARTAADAAAEKAAAVEKNAMRLTYEVVLSEDQGGFKFNAAELPDEAKAALDAMLTQIKADPKGAFFEIEGHTDNSGPGEINERIGLERAEAVKRYL